MVLFAATPLAHMDSGADAVWIQGRAVMSIRDSGHDSWQVYWKAKKHQNHCEVRIQPYAQFTHRNIHSFLMKQGSVDGYGCYRPIRSASILHPRAISD
jgi:hypothetical protein